MGSAIALKLLSCGLARPASIVSSCAARALAFLSVRFGCPELPVQARAATKAAANGRGRAGRFRRSVARGGSASVTGGRKSSLGSWASWIRWLSSFAEVEAIAEVLELAIIIEGRRPAVVESQRLQERQLLRAGVTA